MNAAFSVDVEDGVSIAMRDAFGVQSPQTDRVVVNTQKILDLLAAHQVQGTFFILGEVAEEFPGLIKKIATAGHEIGVHGYNHLQFFRMTRQQATEELSSAKKLLEDLSGQEAKGHRAPAFSVTPQTEWALDVIAECGFTYDSSIIPIDGSRYGWPGFTKEIVQLRTKNGNHLIEVPISTIAVLGREVPFSGGGYLRLFPFVFTKNAFKKNGKKRPTIHYMHPYELDTTRYPEYYFEELRKVPKVKALKMRSYWINRSTIYGKLEKLLTSFHFTTIAMLIQQAKQEQKIELVELEALQNQTA